MWGMFVDEALNNELSTRAQARLSATDPKEWKASLAEARKAAKKLRKNSQNGHVCMIIGYNPETEEIATTDSWGPEFAERWWTVEEAEALSQNYLQVIKW